MDTNMTKERLMIIINNLLCQICDTTCIADSGKKVYYDWLRIEIGLTENEIKELKDADCFPEPMETEDDLK